MEYQFGERNLHIIFFPDFSSFFSFFLFTVSCNITLHATTCVRKHEAKIDGGENWKSVGNCVYKRIYIARSYNRDYLVVLLCHPGK